MEAIVSVEWLANQLGDPELVILDATIPKVTAGGGSTHQDKRIVGARFFDLKKVFSDQNSELPNTLPDPESFTQGCRKLGINHGSKIVVYDRLGVYSSPRARWLFNIMGHKAIAVLDGGLPEWIAQGYETEPTESSFYPLGDFESHFQTDLVKHRHDILENLESADAQVIDARSPGRFNGTAPEPRDNLRSGHIPKSVNLYYNQVLRDGKFLPKQELKSVIEELKLGDSPLIFSCGSGITACIIMLACELTIGNDKAVYDGSWSEWGLSDNDLPIES